MDFTAGIAISLHLLLDGNYNPIHPYAQVERDDWAVGAYYNSESKISTYVSKTFDLGKDFELEIGAVTGYFESPVMPLVRLKKDKFFIAPVNETWNGKKNIGIVTGIQF